MTEIREALESLAGASIGGVGRVTRVDAVGAEFDDPTWEGARVHRVSVQVTAISAS